MSEEAHFATHVDPLELSRNRSNADVNSASDGLRYMNVAILSILVKVELPIYAVISSYLQVYAQIWLLEYFL